MIKTKKQSLIVIGAFALVMLLGTVTYAFFNYTRTGGGNTIKVGRIAFNSEQGTAINLTDMFPIDTTVNGIMNDNTKVGSVTVNVTGDTTYSEGIEYLVSAVNVTNTAGSKTLPISINVSVANNTENDPVTDLGTADTDYFTNRGGSTSIYKVLATDTISNNDQLVVGYIAPGATGVGGNIVIKAYLDKTKVAISDTYPEEVVRTVKTTGYSSSNCETALNGIANASTYCASASSLQDAIDNEDLTSEQLTLLVSAGLVEEYTNGTPSSFGEGKTVLTTDEWNSLQTNGVSFQVKVEAQEGIWVNEIRKLYEIMQAQNLNPTTNQPTMDNAPSQFVTTSTGINFGAVSSDTNGKGVYMRAGTENDDYPILYYRGAVENNNVIFANKCWKAVRTTDTGGVKLIYNGETSAIYTDVPLTESQYTIPSGATNNFTFNSTDNSWEITITDNSEIEISFTVPAAGNYKLVQVGTSSSTSGGGWKFYKDGTSVKWRSGGYGQSMNDTYSFKSLTSSNVIKWTYSGSASAESPVTFKLQMMQSGNLITENGCDNIGTDTLINMSGTNMFAFNTNQNSPAYVGYMYGDAYTADSEEPIWQAYFGSNFTYDGTNYKLVDSVTTMDDTHHYTCDLTSAEGTCTTLRYYFYKRTLFSTEYGYVNLTGGDGIEEALAKMQTNTTDSNAKIQIDSWYASNMSEFTNKLEDTIWCNDRSMADNNGWIANGGNLSKTGFGATRTLPSLICANKNDSFTVSNTNGNGALNYPVALLTKDEIVLAGGYGGSLSTFYLNNGNASYWSLSPGSFLKSYGSDEMNSYEYFVGPGTYTDSGDLLMSTMSTAYGLRPAISLKLGTRVASGTGTVSDPFVIE